MLVDAIAWIGAHPTEFLDALRQHLLMSVISLGIGLLIGLPLAVLVLPTRVGAGLTVGW